MKQSKWYLLTYAVTALVGLTAGTSLYASDADTKIEESFEQTYVYKTYLKDDSIKADAKDGVVTLTGTVSSELNKALAQDTVSGIAGVTRVDNKLITDAQAATESADKWIGRKVKLALLFHRHVNYGNTTVDVKDGVVTLKGEAMNAAQKELTAEYAKDIDGVKSVKNEMTVGTAPAPAERTAGEKIDDASITAQVKTVLAYHRSTSMVKAKIDTRNGVVTLTGIAKNAAEKTLITKLISDINGVTSVDNQMTVDEVKTK